ncbi:LAFE_0D06150g1_1 [Lachancea fermentati]|uniref:LAFE_0D06150g1_1 n=1 Tax=Lachancea fermentati TaxID=4955 RepID=A0A1G4MBG1_LACFM|nr:LAFE_0D06150g1_1 [Lachancea fermentati]
MHSVETSLKSISRSYYQSHVKPLISPLLENVERVNMSTIYAATAIGAALVLLMFYPSRSGKKPRSKGTKKKKQRQHQNEDKKNLSLEDQINAVHEKYVSDYKTGLANLLEAFDGKSEQHDYQRKYYNEMLLKLLIELDGVDLVGLEGERKKILKEKRKQAIKEIQGDLKKLDAIS